MLNLNIILTKKNSTSKFHGVSKIYGKYHVVIKNGRESVKLGPFEDEIEAALAYNDKIVSLRGPGTPINYISNEELELYEEYRKEKEKMIEDFYLNVNSKNRYRNFYPLETDGSSRFVGVFKVKNRWLAGIVHKRKRNNIGYFYHEIDAALAYNEEAIRLHGENATLNFISKDEYSIFKDQITERDWQYFEHREDANTVYTNVYFDKSVWVATISFDHKSKYIGYYPTDKLAAIAYNHYVIQNELARKLNKIDGISMNDYESILQEFEEEKKYFPHKTGGKTIYTNVRISPGGHWRAHIVIDGKSKVIGKYETDWEAAIAYNAYVKFHKLDRQLNKIVGVSQEAICGQEKQFIDDQSYYRHRIDSPTIYTNVSYKQSGNWEAQIKHDGKSIHIGTYSTDWEAAIACNAYTKYHKLDFKLNKIVGIDKETIKEHESRFEEDQKYFRHKTDGDTIYTNVGKSNQKWSAFLRLNNKQVNLGYTFATAKEAAIAYNEYVLENKLDRKLNKIV